MTRIDESDAPSPRPSQLPDNERAPGGSRKNILQPLLTSQGQQKDEGQKRKERQQTKLEVLSVRKVVERPKMLRPGSDSQQQRDQAQQDPAARQKRSRKLIGLLGPCSAPSRSSAHWYSRFSSLTIQLDALWRPMGRKPATDRFCHHWIAGSSPNSVRKSRVRP